MIIDRFYIIQLDMVVYEPKQGRKDEKIYTQDDPGMLILM